MSVRQLRHAGCPSCRLMGHRRPVFKSLSAAIKGHDSFHCGGCRSGPAWCSCRPRTTPQGRTSTRRRPIPSGPRASHRTCPNVLAAFGADDVAADAMSQREQGLRPCHVGRRNYTPRP
jgi:hypothetical protein